MSSVQTSLQLLWADSYDRKGDTQPRMHFFLCGARYANAQRSSHTAQDSREFRHDPESGGGMLMWGSRLLVLTLVCGHQVSHPKDALKSGRSRLPPISS